MKSRDPSKKQDTPRSFEDPIQARRSGAALDSFGINSHGAALAIQRNQLEKLQDSSRVVAQKKEMEQLTGQSEPVQKAPEPNRTGMPDQLKSGMERLSGVDLSDVKVHRNSSKPSELQAHAYAQGTDVHVAPGQDRHLPHEMWHVVQQKEGRVRPTTYSQGVAINDDQSLEKEADVMGAKALSS